MLASFSSGHIADGVPNFKQASVGGGEVAEYAYQDLGTLGGSFSVGGGAEYVDPMSGVYVTAVSPDGSGSLYAEAEEMTVEVSKARKSSITGEEHEARPLVRKASTYDGFGGADLDSGGDATATMTMDDGTVWEGDETDDEEDA